MSRSKQKENQKMVRAPSKQKLEESIDRLVKLSETIGFRQDGDNGNGNRTKSEAEIFQRQQQEKCRLLLKN